MGHPGTNRMKSLMWSFVCWLSMDQDITNMVKTCKGCALAVKAPAITHKPWPKSEQPSSRIHIDYAGPLEDFYYSIVDSCSKWPEVLRCRKPSSATTINSYMSCLPVFVLRIVWFVTMPPSSLCQSSRNSVKTYLIKHITTPQYHPRSNGQAEHFVDTLKSALKKAYDSPMEKSLQQFLQVYRFMANPNIPESRSPAEAMFGRKIRSVFEKLLLKQTLQNRTSTVPFKWFNLGDKVYFKHFRNIFLLGTGNDNQKNQ